MKDLQLTYRLQKDSQRSLAFGSRGPVSLEYLPRQDTVVFNIHINEGTFSD